MARTSSTRKTTRSTASLTRETPVAFATEGATLATVRELSDDGVRLDDGTRATLAVPGFRPNEGDRVVVVRGHDGTFVVGVVSTSRAPALSTDDGVRADLDGSILRVRDAEGRVLFEHDPARGCSVLLAPSGDLELRADAGNVRIVSAGSVAVEADRTVDVRGSRGVRLGNGSATGEPGTTLGLDTNGLRAAAPQVEVLAERADVHVLEGRLTARIVESTVGVVRQLADIVETRATRILTRAKDAYAHIEGLAQTRAGRVRTVADDAVHISGAQTMIKGREDVKIRGEKIHLG